MSSAAKRLSSSLPWAVAASVMVAALLWPALWNGFPIVTDDTGGYLARPFEHSLLFGRSALYGMFLSLGIPLDFWPNIFAQSALIAWLVVLTLRAHGFCRPSHAVAAVIGLSGFTGLPWFVSQLMPDVLAPACTLAIYLLAFRARILRRGETFLLGAVIATAMASHMSTLALSLALLALIALIRPFARKLRLPLPDLAPAALAVALGVLLGPLSNLAIAGRFVFTPGGANIVFARLVESGIVARYLSERCPDPDVRLCAFRDRLPAKGNDWLWHAKSPLPELGGTDRFEPEAQRIVLGILLAYPGQHLATAFTGTAEQFSKVGTGYTTRLTHWHARWALERFAPNAVPPFLESRQHKTGLDLSWLGSLHVPVAIIAIAVISIFALLAGPCRIRPRIAALSGLMLAALLSNAAICGSFAVPSDRYQNRLAPIAPLAAGLAVLGLRRRPWPDIWIARSRARMTPVARSTGSNV